MLEETNKDLKYQEFICCGITLVLPNEDSRQQQQHVKCISVCHCLKKVWSIARSIQTPIREFIIFRTLNDYTEVTPAHLQFLSPPLLWGSRNT